MTASFVRMFANTDGGPASKVGWAFMRRLIRKLPVRLISMSPGMSGCWTGYEALLATPMTGDFVNVIACEPARWTWNEHVRAPAKPVSIPDFAESGVAFEAELVAGRVELWTAGVRNVLIAATLPSATAKDAHFQLETARKYDAVIVTKMADAEWLERHGIAAIEIGEPFPDVVVIEAILGAS